MYKLSLFLFAVVHLFSSDFGLANNQKNWRIADSVFGLTLYDGKVGRSVLGY